MHLPGNDQEQKNSVLFLSGVRGDTRRYRTMHPYEQLRLLDLPCLLSHVMDPDVVNKVNRSDVVIFHRVQANSFVEGMINRVRSRGGLVLVDTDDLIFDQNAFGWIDSPDFMDPVRADLYRENMIRYRRTLELSQGAITSTDFLKNEINSLGKKAWVCRNAFNLQMLANSDAARKLKKENDQVSIGYASGTPTHNRDFGKIIPAIKILLDKYPALIVSLAGALDTKHELDEYSDRVRKVASVSWLRLPDVLAGFDINLAPLVEDNPFAQSKSEIKYVEAGLVEVPTVASPISSYRQAIESGRNGFLASTTDEWVSALDQLIQDGELRKSIGRCAREDVLSHFGPLTRGNELVRVLNEASYTIRGCPIWDDEAIRIPQTPPPHGFITPAMEMHPTNLDMSLYSLKYRGLRTFIREIYIYFRRLISPVFPYKAHSA